MAVSLSDADLASYRKKREEIRDRHAGLFAKTDGDDRGGGRRAAAHRGSKSVRQHQRWKELMKEEGQSDELGRDSIQGTHDSSTLLGPAFFPAECTVRNDYSQHYIDSGLQDLPGNAVRNPYIASRFVEYPKLRKLIKAKGSLVDHISVPPIYRAADLLPSIQSFASAQVSSRNAFHLIDLSPNKFDVVLIDPPLEAYEWESCPSSGTEAGRTWSWDQIAALPVPQIMAKESFVFLWVGSGAGDGLERGREVLIRWGFRRCEDIVWIRTNEDDRGTTRDDSHTPTCSAFTQTVQHCLMGIRGTVTRSRDAHFVHCNVDTDVILWPGEKSKVLSEEVIDVRAKPPEMMDLIENFCLGTRRLELFGRNRNLRRGWLTVGLELGDQHTGWEEAMQGKNACAATSSGTEHVHLPVRFDKSSYDSCFLVDRPNCPLRDRGNLVPYSEEIDLLRPRTPPSNEQQRSARHTHGDGSARRLNKLDNANARNRLGGGAVAASGAGLSGLGAGGNAVVSVPSGSELLSGAQAHVILGGQQGGGVGHGAVNSPHSGPSGLGRKSRRAI